MSVRTVLVCEAQVPFVTGGAEAHVRQLVDALRARGYEAELCEPSAEAIGAAVATLDGDRRQAATLGSAGRETASRITWDGVVEKLVEA